MRLLFDGLAARDTSRVVANPATFKQERPKMNKDQVKGVGKDVAGKVQENAGKLIGSKEQEAKGLAKQVTGKIQKGYGDAKEAVKDSGKR